MDLAEAIKGRRSIRKYQKRDIPDAMIRELLDLARYAASSMNGQPWYFIVIKEEKTKNSLIQIKNKNCPPEKSMFPADFLKNAPVIIVVCVDREKSFDREIENAVLATANILLGASDKGLGSVYMSAYRKGDSSLADNIRDLLGIPAHVDPITIIPLGYPDENPEPKLLLGLEEVIFYENFGR
jgi:nitroreductase